MAVPVEQIMLMAAVLSSGAAVHIKGLSAVGADLDVMDAGASAVIMPVELPVFPSALLAAEAAAPAGA